MNSEPFVLTISHQIGSGGSVLGRKISERLGVPFIDRQILQAVADKLHVSETALQNREEKVSSFWQTFNHLAVFSDPVLSMAPNHYVPSDQDLFQLESDYIGRIAEKTSAIILGRCGWYILRKRPNHVSILLHATMPDRVLRVRDMFHLSQNEAEKFIDSNDKERTAYVQRFTKQFWLDASLYDLCLDTSSIGIDQAIEMEMDYLQQKALTPNPSPEGEGNSSN
jgi:cytidylate kinase